MKKSILLLTLAAGLGFAAKAQVKVGLKAGVAFPNVSVSPNEEGEFKANTSLYFGGLVDVSIGNIFSFQPGVTLIGKGTKQQESERVGQDSYTLTNKLNLMYLEVPLNLLANFEAGAGKVFIGGGPYYGMAISGKTKSSYEAMVDGEKESDSESEDVKFGKDGDIKRGDFGINFLGGYQLKNGFNIHAGYGLGLGNISSDSDDVKVKNKLFSVGVGFTF